MVMGIRSSAKLDPSSNIIRVLIELYVEVGDQIALQYGGSEAHKKVDVETSESSFHGPMGKVRKRISHVPLNRLGFSVLHFLISLSAVTIIAQRASYLNS